MSAFYSGNLLTKRVSVPVSVSVTLSQCTAEYRKVTMMNIVMNFFASVISANTLETRKNILFLQANYCNFPHLAEVSCQIEGLFLASQALY